MQPYNSASAASCDGEVRHKGLLKEKEHLLPYLGAALQLHWGWKFEQDGALSVLLFFPEILLQLEITRMELGFGAESLES